MDDKYKSHPSFATLYIGRTFCNGKQNLFGSSIKHNEVITLKISPASITRNLNNDYIFSDPNSYIEINMSQAQFAQAITSFNMGDGTPVTLRKLNVSYIYSQFNKQMDKTVTEAKAEVEGHIKARIDDMASRGIDLTSKQDTLPEIPAAADTGGEDEDMGMNMGGM